MNFVSTETKLVGLIGYPLKQASSPVIMNTAFECRGLNYLYLPIEVTEENLEILIKGISKMNFAGLNVTMPYKVSIMKYLDEVDEQAKVIGAVNTITIKNGRMKGYNTDGIGLIRSLKEEKDINIKGKKIFILGSGGAAKAIATTLAYEDADRIDICNRTPDKATSLAKSINSKVKDCCRTVPMNFYDMKESLMNTDILINTTNVGMTPSVGEIPMDERLLNSRMVVCDIIYKPSKTKLLLEAENIGCIIMNGLGLLIHQGTIGFKLWTGIDAPINEMKQKALESISDYIGL